MRRITIFGATGSIGQNTIDLIKRAPAGTYDVVALTGGRNIAQLAKDAIALDADIAVTAFDDEYDALKTALAGSNIHPAAGAQALQDAADRPVDWVMSAIMGAAGLEPGLRALRNGACLALANKESLVTAGPLMLQTARAHNATILPVDSEHSAVFQALTGEDITKITRIIITASGGALRDWPVDDLPKATIADVTRHPNWDMGQRITIDSASMFNKAMELIETKEFFGVAPDKIETVIHPQSIIHALVGFCDGALMAHLGAPDMRHAIGYALHHPHRRPLPVADIARLDFSPACETRYRALRLARQVMQTGGHAGAVFNAAKETALDGFLAGQITFTQMAELVDTVLNQATADPNFTHTPTSLEDVLQTDHMTRNRTWRAIKHKETET